MVGGPPHKGLGVAVGTIVEVGAGAVAISRSIVSVDLAWDMDVAGISVRVGITRDGVLVGSSSPGPRGVVNCSFAFGYRTIPAIMKITTMIPSMLKKSFRFEVCITKKFLDEVLVTGKSFGCHLFGLVI